MLVLRKSRSSFRSAIPRSLNCTPMWYIGHSSEQCTTFIVVLIEIVVFGRVKDTIRFVPGFLLTFEMKSIPPSDIFIAVVNSVEY